MAKVSTLTKVDAGQLERFGVGHNDVEMLRCTLCGDVHHLDVMAYGVQTYIVDTDDVGYFCPNCVDELNDGTYDR